MKTRVLVSIFLAGCSDLSPCDSQGVQGVETQMLELVASRVGATAEDLRDCDMPFIAHIPAEDSSAGMRDRLGLTMFCGEHGALIWVRDDNQANRTLEHELTHWALRCITSGGFSDPEHLLELWGGVR